MSKWSRDELGKIAEADDLHNSPFLEGGRADQQLHRQGLPGAVQRQPIPQLDDSSSLGT